MEHLTADAFDSWKRLYCVLMLTVGCWVAGQLAGRKGAVVANTNLVKIAIHNGLKYYMLAPLPRGKGARKRAELGLSVRLMLSLPLCKISTVI